LTSDNIAQVLHGNKKTQLTGNNTHTH